MFRTIASYGICSILMLYSSYLRAVEVLIEEEIEDVKPVAADGLSGGTILRTIEIPGASDISAFALSSDNRTLACVSAKQDVVFLEFETGSVLGKIQVANGVNEIAFHPNNDYVATASNDGTATIWSMKTQKLVRKFTGHNESVQAVTFSPDGALMATACKSSALYVHAVNAGRKLFTLSGHNNEISALVFSPDGRTLLSEAADVTARLWDIPTQRPLCVLNDRDGEVAALAIGPDGRIGASTRGDNTWQIFEIPSGSNLLLLQGHSKPGSCAVFAPDGLSVFTGSIDGTIGQWDLISGQELRRITVSGSKVDRIALTNDGSKLLSLSVGRCLVWDVLQPPGPRVDQTGFEERTEDAWKDLGSVEYRTRLEALWYFLNGGERTVGYLIGQLQPTGRLEDETLKKLIAELDDNRFTVRERASSELKQYAAHLRSFLQRAGQSGSPEVRMRILKLLHDQTHPEFVQTVLALELLGWSKLPQARTHLEALAAGLPAHPQTRLAKAILARGK